MIINKILKELKESKYLFIHIFNDEEVVFYIWEREVPIAFNPKNKELILDIEGYDWRFTKDMLEEIVVVMDIIKENSDEVCEWVKDI